MREAALAWQLEQRWSKDRILARLPQHDLLRERRLRHPAGGAHVLRQGRPASSRSPSRLCSPGIPADPSLYDPTAASRAPRSNGGTTSSGRCSTRARSPPASSGMPRAAPLPSADDVRLPGTQGPASTSSTTSRISSIAKYGAGRVFGGGLRVTTTIDLELQETAHRGDRERPDDARRPGRGARRDRPARPARSGRWSAARTSAKSQFNLATQAERQPGSSFKPIVLATALRQGISPVTTFESKPVEIDAGDRIWQVTNYEGSYLGRVDLARAMVSSDNAVYAQLTKLVGPKAIVKTAHALGIRSELDPYFSIGLGAVAVNPLDMTRAYATFANRGRRVDGSLTGDRPRVVEQRRVRADRPRGGEPPGRPGDDDDRRGRSAHLDPAARRDARHRQARGTGRPARWPARPERPTTTATPGSSATPRSSPWRSGSGIPTELKPMLTEFGGEARRRRNAAGSDLEGVHDSCGNAAGGRARAVRR